MHPETEADPHKVTTKILPWGHIITGECQSGIEAIHKEVDESFLLLYLNEYYWKFNRRFFRDSKENRYDLFDHLIRIAAKNTSNMKWRDCEDAHNGINRFLSFCVIALVIVLALIVPLVHIGVIIKQTFITAIIAGSHV